MKRALEQDRRWKTDDGRRMTDDGTEKQTPGIQHRTSNMERTDDRPEKMDDNDRDVAAETEPSDDAIIERIRNGDMNAFELLTRRYNRWVFGIVTKRVPRAQAPDTVQEVFIEAYQSLRCYRLNTSFKQWLTTIAKRHCYDYWYAENRHPVYAVSNLNTADSEAMEQWLQATACEAAQSEMEMEKMRETLLPAISRLEPDNQTILWLIYWNGCSPEETAEILGYSPGNVRVRASRAHAQLRQFMDSPVNMTSPASEHILLESTAVPA